ncbi:MAG: hypothetical protein NTW22_01670, partial [Proteobacteria bacterium]|nr:hypothetical protein [Pseudomonadota bacterium]
MKSSLKFTAIALLLGGVLHVQNLNAATYASAAAVPYDSEINPFAVRVSRIFASPGTPKEFATSIDALSKTSSNTNNSNQEKRLLLYTLVSEVVKSELPLTFFETALADDSVKVKLFVAACVAVKQARISSDITISEQSAEIDALTLALEKRVGAHTDEIIDLQGQVNELREELDQVYETLESTSVRAFLPLTGPSVITPVEELAAYTVVASKPSTLPLAEQMYLLKVREHLGDPVKLGASLTQLDTLMKFVRNIASDVSTPESLARSALLRDIIPQVQGIAPIIGGYMQSILGQIAAINTDVHSRRGYFVSGTPTPIQTLQLSELDARKNLAYSVFDAIFGAMTKPASVPASVDFRADQSPANVLTSKVQTLHTTLPLTVSSSAIVVKNDGSIATIKEADFLTGID